MTVYLEEQKFLKVKNKEATKVKRYNRYSRKI